MAEPSACRWAMAERIFAARLRIHPHWQIVNWSDHDHDLCARQLNQGTGRAESKKRRCLSGVFFGTGSENFLRLSVSANRP